MVQIRQFTFHILLALLISGIFIAVIVILKQFDLNPANKLPCQYFDSINITDGKRDNGDIIYKNVTFKKGQYAEVNTVLSYDKDKVGEFTKVAPYLRGCLCNRPGVNCVRLCCSKCLTHDFEEDLRNELRNLSFYTLAENKNLTFVPETCGMDKGALDLGPDPYVSDVCY